MNIKMKNEIKNPFKKFLTNIMFGLFLVIIAFGGGILFNNQINNVFGLKDSNGNGPSQGGDEGYFIAQKLHYDKNGDACTLTALIGDNTKAKIRMVKWGWNIGDQGWVGYGSWNSGLIMNNYYQDFGTQPKARAAAFIYPDTNIETTAHLNIAFHPSYYSFYGEISSNNGNSQYNLNTDDDIKWSDLINNYYFVRDTIEDSEYDPDDGNWMEDDTYVDAVLNAGWESHVGKMATQYQTDKVAVLQGKTSTITFEKNGASSSSGTSSVTRYYYEYLPKITPPTRSGYAFKGYYKESSLRNKVYNADGTVVSNSLNTSTSNVTYYAKWNRINRITFDKMGGTGGTDYVNVETGVSGANITIPTKSGYVFKGYYDSKVGGTQYYNENGVAVRTFDFNSDTTLYAQWDMSSTVAMFNLNTGLANSETNLMILNPNLDSGVTYNAGTGIFNININDGQTGYGPSYVLGYSQYMDLSAGDTFTVMYQYVGGSRTGGTYVEIEAVDKDGNDLPDPDPAIYLYQFLHQDELTVSGIQKFVYTLKTTDYGSPKKLRIRLYNEGARSYTNLRFRIAVYSGNSTTQVVGPMGEPKSKGSTYGQLPAPVRDGYAFSGWFTQATGGTQVKPSTTVTSSTAHELFAHWKKLVKVNYDANGGTGLSFTEDYAYVGDPYGKVNVYDPSAATMYSKSSYITLKQDSGTLGYYYHINYNGTTQKFNFQLSSGLPGFASNTPYTAIVGVYYWSIKNNMTIRLGVSNYLAGSAGFTITASDKVYKSGTFKIRDLSTFNDSVSLGSYIDTGNTTSKTTNFHFWIGIYVGNVISQYANITGGSYSSSTNAPAVGAMYRGSTLQTPTRDGYNFVGWSTVKNDASKIVTASSIVETTTEHTLYAVWERDSVSVEIRNSFPTAGIISDDSSKSGEYFIGDTVTVKA
ncbi:MAG: InlB B-repeat-containing protein, partial [Christensenellales bacterium]